MTLTYNEAGRFECRWVYLKPNPNSTSLFTEGLNDLMTKQKGFSLQNFVEHVIPKSFVEAMATNEILQLVVFRLPLF